MKKFFFLFLISLTVLQGQTRLSGSDLLNMPTDDALEAISGINQTEAQELVSEIRQAAKKDYKKIDNFYFLISHLEEMQAIETEQKRLGSLNLVYVLGLVLLLSFLLYIFVTQRKIIKELQHLK